MKRCNGCEKFGYTDDNGQPVCEDGRNFDYKSGAYRDMAFTCRGYKAAGGAWQGRPAALKAAPAPFPQTPAPAPGDALMRMCKEEYKQFHMNVLRTMMVILALTMGAL